MRIYLKEDQEVQLNDLPAKLPVAQKAVTKVWGTFNGPVTIKQIAEGVDTGEYKAKATAMEVTKWTVRELVKSGHATLVDTKQGALPTEPEADAGVPATAEA